MGRRVSSNGSMVMVWYSNALVPPLLFFFFLKNPPPTEIHPLPPHAPLPICPKRGATKHPCRAATPTHPADFRHGLDRGEGFCAWQSIWLDLDDPCGLSCGR